MALVSLKEILAGTREGKYAVGSFNFNGFEDVKGMIRGGVETNAPVIVMSSPATTRYLGLYAVCGMVKGLAEDAGIPVTLHLDHCMDEDFIQECVKAGFTSVMFDASSRPYQENIEASRRIAEFAHSYGCSVEAELGVIGGHEEGAVSGEILYTNPADVPDFVEKTGVDALAVAVGTVHGFYKSAPKIDFDRITDICQLTECPIVLHGGTGVPKDDFKRAIACGISKINVGTELKYAFSDSLKKATAEKSDENDPRKLMKVVTDDCEKIVREKVEMFGSGGHGGL